MDLPYKNDKRAVLTLDAGGTKFSFSAMAGGEQIIEPKETPSHGDHLTLCLNTIVAGFEDVMNKLGQKPAAISFAFPGPAWYPQGIIGDLGNLPGFRGGIALGPMLEDKFGVPVFINNDGDLFTLGEAVGGFLPEMNLHLVHADSTRRYRNLIGFTLGTGFGGGIVRNGELFIGDNSAAGEVWLLHNARHAGTFAEESISIRALRRSYKAHCRIGYRDDLTAKDIYRIAADEIAGDIEAARTAFGELGDALGEAIANVLTVIDGLVVIGGGLSNAWEFFAPAMMRSLGQEFTTLENPHSVPRLEMQAFNVEDKEGYDNFLRGRQKTVTIPGSEKKITYDAMKCTGVGRSRLSTSKAVSLGAYAFALRQLDAD